MTKAIVIPQEATPLDFERFWEKVDKSSGPDACWHWTGNKTDQGYGQVWWRKRRYRAHRWLLVQMGLMPNQSLVIDHTCHNDSGCNEKDECAHRRCVNPSHLEPVTQQVNASRGMLGPKSHCRTGHEYTEENSYFSPAGARSCRECHRIDMRNRGRIASGIPLDAPIGISRYKTHCKWGHELVPENRYNGKGCRKCTKISNDAKPRNGLHNVRPRITHCKYGHEYTEENTHTNKNGSRSCRVCRKTTSDKSNAKQAAARKALRDKHTIHAGGAKTP